MSSLNSLNIAVFGLGYVGTVTMACLARAGHVVTGCDVAEQKVEAINSGRPPIVEPGVAEMIAEAASEGRISATSDIREAVSRCDVVIICVGTPSQLSGEIDLAHVERVFRQLADALPESAAVILRSTVLPGSTRALAEILPGRNRDHLYFVPEFLREGSAVRDFEQPSIEVLGSADGQRPESSAVFAVVGQDVVAMTWEEAELVKYTCNAFHATKVVFANEVGRLAKHLDVDGRRVMELVCTDTKLNISPYYLRPGNPYGGSCLPKDVKAILRMASREGIEVPLLASLEPSNRAHLTELLRAVETAGHRRVVIIGLAFKAGTDDLRHSPMVAAAQHLLGHGYELSIYDQNLELSTIQGSNRRSIDVQLPHLGRLLTDSLEQVAAEPCTLLVGHSADAEEIRRWVTPDHVILDINGQPDLAQLDAKYHGLCW